MNRKQFTIILLVLFVLGIAGLSVYRKQNASSGGDNPAVGKKVLPDFAYNNVVLISLKEGTNQVNLVKKDDLWRVQERNDYPANYSEISEFLLKWKGLKVVQTEEVGASDLRRLWLAPDQTTNNPVVVDLKDAAGKSITTLMLGKKQLLINGEWRDATGRRERPRAAGGPRPTPAPVRSRPTARATGPRAGRWRKTRWASDR